MTDKAQVERLFGKLIRSGIYLFPEPRKKITAPNERGVYIINSPKGKVLHVGRTPKAKNGIAQRLRDHLAGNSSFVVKHFNREGARLRNGYKFKYLVVSNNRLRAILEAYAIGHLCPAHIGLGEK
jgi:excinuclease UvrABC nuclease subunit